MPKSGLFGICLVKSMPSIVKVLWSTYSKQIMFGCSLDIRHTNKCNSLRLGYTSTSTFLSFPHASFRIRVRMWLWLKTFSVIIFWGSFRVMPAHAHETSHGRGGGGVCRQRCPYQPLTCWNLQKMFLHLPSVLKDTFGFFSFFQ